MARVLGQSGQPRHVRLYLPRGRLLGIGDSRADRRIRRLGLRTLTALDVFRLVPGNVPRKTQNSKGSDAKLDAFRVW